MEGIRLTQEAERWRLAWGLLYSQGEIGSNISESMEALKDQVQTSGVRGHFTLQQAKAGTCSRTWWVGEDGEGMGIVPGSWRRQGSFSWRVSTVSGGFVRADSEFNGTLSGTLISVCLL